MLDDVKEYASEFVRSEISKYESLNGAYRFSAAKIEEIRKAIAISAPPVSCFSLAAAGSIARHDASALSDLDLIVIAPASDLSESDDPVMTWRDGLCKRLSIERPNATGVFAKSVDRQLLLDHAGSAEESYQTAARRMLLLMESRWLHNEVGYIELIDNIVDKYSEYVLKNPEKNFVFLLNDVCKFFRSLCVNYQWTTSETPDGKWPIRNLKLRHSRVLIYFSMIAVMGCLSCVKTADKINVLKYFIGLTPLQRLFVVYRISEDNGFEGVARRYDMFISRMSRSEVRDKLFELEYSSRYDDTDFVELKRNSDELASELYRFFLARSDRWSPKFLEYTLL